MLSISTRDCFLADDYSGKRREKEGEPDIRTLKLGLTQIAISKHEINALFAEPNAYELLYDTSRKPHRPWLMGLKALEFAAKWPGAYVAIHYGENFDSELKLSAVTLSKIKLSLINEDVPDDFTPTLSCQIEAEPPLDTRIAEIIACTGTLVQCEIRASRPPTQPDLPLNRFEDDGPDHPFAAAARKRSNGRPHTSTRSGA